MWQCRRSSRMSCSTADYQYLIVVSLGEEGLAFYGTDYDCHSHTLYSCSTVSLHCQGKDGKSACNITTVYHLQKRSSPLSLSPSHFIQLVITAGTDHFLISQPLASWGEFLSLLFLLRHYLSHIIYLRVYLRMGGWDSVTGRVRRWKAWVQNLGWARTGMFPGSYLGGFN